MSCWDVLGIEPTDDKKAIKKAYAVLLKQNKPDENPSGFAQLHEAYKQALDMTAYIRVEHRDVEEQAPLDPASVAVEETVEISQPAEPPPGGERLIINDAPAEEPPAGTLEEANREVIDDPYLDSEQEAFLASLESAWTELLEKTQAAMSRMKEEDAVDAWRFLQDREEFCDLGFKAAYSHYLFESFLEFFNDKNTSPVLCVRSLRYLNELFFWEDQSRHLKEQYGSYAVESMLRVLAVGQESVEARQLQWTVGRVHRGPMEAANYYARLAATFIDGVLMFMLTVMLASLAGGSLQGSDKILLTLPIYALLTPLMEASPMQGTVGKIIFGMKVTNKSGRRLSVLHAIWRQIMYLLSTVAFKITVWINLFLRDGRLLHDRLSASIVIKR